jgi:hypothetical protein
MLSASERCAASGRPRSVSVSKIPNTGLLESRLL